MATSQKSFLQILAIWVGLILLGWPVAALLAPLFAGADGGGEGTIFVLVLVGWLALWGVFGIRVRQLGWRIAFTRAALLLVGVLLAFLLSANNVLQYLVAPLLRLYARNPAFPVLPSFLIFFWLLAFWSLLYGFLTRSTRGMYVALHFFNWLFWLGIIFALFGGSVGNLVLLIIPLGISLLLLGFRESIIRGLATLPFLQKSWQPTAAPKPADPPGYEQGYRPSFYKEGGNVYTYSPDEEDTPTAYSPQAETQQQQQ